MNNEVKKARSVVESRKFFLPLVKCGLLISNGNQLLHKNICTEISQISTMLGGFALLCFCFSTLKTWFFTVPLGIACIAGAICVVLNLGVYSVIDLEYNTIFKALAFKGIYLFKTKPVKISDIQTIAVNRKRIWVNRNSVGDIELLLDTFKDSSKKLKEDNNLDGCIESVGISYITNDGKMKKFNAFSEYEGAEEVNTILVGCLAEWIGIPYQIAGADEAFVVNKIAGKYRFSKVSIKVTFWSAFIDTLKRFAIGAVLIVVIFTIVGIFVYSK